MSRALIFDGEFYKYRSETCDLHFERFHNGKISSFLLKNNLLKNKWIIIGYMINYSESDTIKFLIETLRIEFSNIKIKLGDMYSWEKDGLMFSSGSSYQILLEFVDNADEAEFILRADNIIDAVKNNKDLIRTS